MHYLSRGFYVLNRPLLLYIAFSMQIFHVSTQQYYRDIKRQTEEQKAEVVELQERKDTAQEELAQVKRRYRPNG